MFITATRCCPSLGISQAAIPSMGNAQKRLLKRIGSAATEKTKSKLYRLIEREVMINA